MTKVICIIPARYASTRLPGKPLADLCGKPLIRWVYERARAASRIQETYVATDDRRIQQAVEGFGGRAIMATGDYQSGTDRIADAASKLPADIVVNLQGDEPMMHPGTIDLAVEALERRPDYSVSAAMVKIRDESQYLSPDTVKVVASSQGRAFYFSRSPLPSLARASGKKEFQGFFGFKHLGLYVYRRDVLLAFPKLSPGFLEKIEQLEQLRLLEHGYAIGVVETSHDSIGVDTPEDLALLRDQFSKRETRSQ